MLSFRFGFGRFGFGRFGFGRFGFGRFVGNLVNCILKNYILNKIENFYLKTYKNNPHKYLTMNRVLHYFKNIKLNTLVNKTNFEKGKKNTFNNKMHDSDTGKGISNTSLRNETHQCK